MSSISLDGVVSGLDTTSMINSLVAVSATRGQQMVSQKDDFQDTLDAVGDFKSALAKVQTSLEELQDPDTFGEYTVSQSAETGFTASVGNDATPGAYDVQVTQLAKAEMEVSQGFADKSTAGVLATGVMEVTYGGNDPVEITIDSDTTLSSLAEELDAVEGLSAFVLDTGDASTPYKLVVMGEDTGEDNTISFDTSALSGGTVPGFTEQVTAQNAKVTVNDIEVSHEDNVIDDVIPGLDLALTQETTEAVTVTVNRDDEAIMDKIEGFVDAWNSLRVMHGANSDYDADNDIKGALFGEGTTKGILSTLGSMISTPSGEATNGEDMSFALLGISTLQTGNLELDRSELQDMLDEDYDYVVEVFSSEDGPAAALVDMMDDTYLGSDGFLASKEDSLEDTIEDLENSIIDFEDRLSDYEERLRNQFTSMEVALGELQSTQSYLSALIEA